MKTFGENGNISFYLGILRMFSETLRMISMKNSIHPQQGRKKGYEKSIIRAFVVKGIF